jgi:hypothetical protein
LFILNPVFNHQHLQRPAGVSIQQGRVYLVYEPDIYRQP